MLKETNNMSGNGCMLSNRIMRRRMRRSGGVAKSRMVILKNEVSVNDLLNKSDSVLF